MNIKFVHKSNGKDAGNKFLVDKNGSVWSFVKDYEWDETAGDEIEIKRLVTQPSVKAIIIK